jgi:two-component system nitrate/nitrite response regulator NarL
MVLERTPPVRIMIAGEHPIFREGLRRLIEAQPAFEIVQGPGEGRTPGELCDPPPDVLLIGLSGRGEAALSMLRDLAASGSPVRVIILTDTVDSPQVRLAVELGARAVVPKDSAPDILFKSIEAVMAGHYWIGREQVSEAVPGLRKLEADRRQSKAFGLTRRELEIVRAVAAGHSNKEIAEQSSISENTVKSHLTHIFNKLGASNRVELALFASHHRLLDRL